MTTYKHTSQVQDRITELASNIESGIGDELANHLADSKNIVNVDCGDVDFLQKLLSDVEDDADGKDYEDSEVEELIALLNFKDRFGMYNTEWNHCATLIHEDNVVDYFKEYCKDVGDIPTNLPEHIVIDWEATAQNMLSEYTEDTIDGATYYFRVN